MVRRFKPLDDWHPAPRLLAVTGYLALKHRAGFVVHIIGVSKIHARHRSVATIWQGTGFYVRCPHVDETFLSAVSWGVAALSKAPPIGCLLGAFLCAALFELRSR